MSVFRQEHVCVTGGPMTGVLPTAQVYTLTARLYTSSLSLQFNASFQLSFEHVTTDRPR